MTSALRCFFLIVAACSSSITIVNAPDASAPTDDRRVVTVQPTLNISPEFRVLPERDGYVVFASSVTSTKIEDHYVLAWNSGAGIVTTRILADGTQPDAAKAVMAGTSLTGPLLVAEQPSAGEVVPVVYALSGQSFSRLQLDRLGRLPTGAQSTGWMLPADRVIYPASLHGSSATGPGIYQRARLLSSQSDEPSVRLTAYASWGASPVLMGVPVSADSRVVSVAGAALKQFTTFVRKSGELAIVPDAGPDCALVEAPSSPCPETNFEVDPQDEIFVESELVDSTLYVVVADRNRSSGATRVRALRFSTAGPSLAPLDAAPLSLFSGTVLYSLEASRARRVLIVPRARGARVFVQTQNEPTTGNRTVHSWDLDTAGSPVAGPTFGIEARELVTALSENLVVVQRAAGTLETRGVDGRFITSIRAVDPLERILGVSCDDACAVGTTTWYPYTAGPLLAARANQLTTIDQSTARAARNQELGANFLLDRMVAFDGAHFLGEDRTNPVRGNLTGVPTPIPLPAATTGRAPVWSILRDRYLVCRDASCFEGSLASGDSTEIVLSDARSIVTAAAIGLDGTHALLLGDPRVLFIRGSERSYVTTTYPDSGREAILTATRDGFVLVTLSPGSIASYHLTRAGLGPRTEIATASAFEYLRVTRDGSGVLVAVEQRDLAQSRRIVVYRLDSKGALRSSPLEITSRDPRLYAAQPDPFYVARNEAGWVFAYNRISGIASHATARTVTLPTLDVE